MRSRLAAANLLDIAGKRHHRDAVVHHEISRPEPADRGHGVDVVGLEDVEVGLADGGLVPQQHSARGDLPHDAVAVQIDRLVDVLRILIVEVRVDSREIPLDGLLRGQSYRGHAGSSVIDILRHQHACNML